MKLQVKICATRSLEAAHVAHEAGADYLGFIFTPNIKTHTISPVLGRHIAKAMKGKIGLVGVFQNMPLPTVLQIVADCNLDVVQLHGDEDPEYLKHIPVPTIKAFRFAGDFDLDKARSTMKRFTVKYYLVDRIKQSEGQMVNMKKVAILARESPIAFAGGLNPDNVAEVIRTVKPALVDVASGVEIDGQQDLGKIRSFISNAKEGIL